MELEQFKEVMTTISSLGDNAEGALNTVILFFVADAALGYLCGFFALWIVWQVVRAITQSIMHGATLNDIVDIVNTDSNSYYDKYDCWDWSSSKTEKLTGGVAKLLKRGRELENEVEELKKRLAKAEDKE